MDRLKELKDWFKSAPLGKKFPMEILGLSHGYAVVYMRVEKTYLVQAETKLIVQGGVLAVLADAAAVLAAMSTLPKGHTPLAHISYDLLSPTTLEDCRLIARAVVTTQNAKWIWVDVKIYGAELDQGDGANLKAVVSAKFAKPKAT